MNSNSWFTKGKKKKYNVANKMDFSATEERTTKRSGGVTMQQMIDHLE